MIKEMPGSRRSSLLLGPEELAAALIRRDRILLLDARYAPEHGSLRDEYSAGHIPGAQFLAIDALAGEDDDRARRSLGTAASIADGVRHWNVDGRLPLVVYGGHHGMSAALAWWALRGTGYSDVRVLDGGMGGWTGKSFPVSSEVFTVDADPSQVPPLIGEPAVLDGAETLRFAARGQLIDARSATKFRAGHVAGALNLPATALIGRNGRLRPDQELRRRFDEAGADLTRPLAVYCGGGVASSYVVLAGATLGAAIALVIEWRES